MSEKILVPVLGESITEATVSKWLKNEGDNVEADEPIVELETDKVNLEVPSPVSGVLTKINSKDGSTVEVGALLGSVSSNSTSSKILETSEKTETLTEESDEPKIDESNVVQLESQEEKEEIEIFDKKDDINETVEKPLIRAAVFINSISVSRSTKASDKIVTWPRTFGSITKVSPVSMAMSCKKTRKSALL